jgi:hypothetical protein
MAPPKRKAGGRVTPKGTRPGEAKPVPPPTSGRVTSDNAARHSTVSSSRYTPPVPKYKKQSPVWLPVLMFALLIVGALLIILNYVDLLPGAVSNWYLLVGLVLIFAGIIVATQYR